MLMDDWIVAQIVAVLKREGRPLGTPEIVMKLSRVNRTKALYRLHCLRAEGKVEGRLLRAGAKGVWVWWLRDRPHAEGGARVPSAHRLTRAA